MRLFYEEVLREFEKEGVKYVLVGGVAVNLLGSFRNTTDLDLLVEMSGKNLAKVVKILTRQGYRVKQPVDPMGIADEKTRKDWIKNKNMRAFNFYKDQEFKEVDLIIDTPVSYEQARKKSVRVKTERMSLPVVSFDHLIKMKEKAGRLIDQADIQELKILKKLKRRKKKSAL